MKSSRRILIISLTALLLLGVISGLNPSLPAAAQVENPQAKVDSKVLESLRGGKSADFIIVMAEQADLSAAYGMADWDERGWYVYNTLKETAARTQKRSLAELKRRGVRAESFFAGNEIYVHAGSEQALNAILALGDAGSVRAPVIVQLEPAAPRFLQSIGPVRPGAALQAETQATIPTWGLEDTNAPDFWAAFGRQGEGIVVASIDSGVKYDHTALAASYRCATESLPYSACWRDASTTNVTVFPYDDNGHGTHTMGTMVGTTAYDIFNYPYTTRTIGMAPKAKWIACRAFDSTGYADDVELNACADWILAPSGNPSYRPHIVNNSWGDTVSSTWFKPKVTAWSAAGIFPVFSAGNLKYKTSCVLMGSPADYLESFTIAAHDISGNIASFSLNGSNLTNYTSTLKPNLSAPGVYVFSAYSPNSSWPYDSAYMSGTSMAAPHVSGAVALLWSCNPYLVGKISLTASLLETSAGNPPAGSCGTSPNGDGNYTYGHGYLNVYQAGIMGCGLAPAAYLPIIMR